MKLKMAMLAVNRCRLLPILRVGQAASAASIDLGSVARFSTLRTVKPITQFRIHPQGGITVGRGKVKAPDHQFLSVSLFHHRQWSLRSESTAASTSLSDSTATDRDNSSFVLRECIKLLKTSDKSARPHLVKTITNSQEFKTVCFKIKENSASMNAFDLLSCLQSLKVLVTSSEPLNHLPIIAVMEELETQLSKKLNSMSIYALLKMVRLFSDHQGHPVRKGIYQDTCAAFEECVTKCDNFSKLVHLLAHTRSQDTDVRIILEDKIMKLQEVLSSDELYRWICFMGSKRVRSLKVIRAMMDRLDFDQSQWELTKLSHLVSVCSTLKFYHLNLFTSIRDKVMKISAELGPESERDISFLLLSQSVLQWKDPELLDTLATVLVRECEHVSSATLLSLLLTCSRLNYRPDILRENFLQVLEAVRHDRPVQWLKAVWCSVILGHSNSELIESVLKEDFVGKLFDGTNLFFLFYTAKCHSTRDLASHLLLLANG